MRAEDRIGELARLIEGYQASYYAGEAEIDDAAFDSLWDELKVLAPDHPLLSRVGSEGEAGGPAGVDGFPKARHLIPMGSQEKAADPEAFRAWAAKMDLPAYVVQHKLDGASLELQYEAGRLVRAVTRGDGIVGDDITANARRMAGVPAVLDRPFTGGVRGEVLMPRETWLASFPDKANCRNAANGVMRRKDGAGCELLELVCYDASSTEDERFFKDELSKVDWLRSRGFLATPAVVLESADAVVAYREEVAAARPSLRYDIDGLVVKDPATDPVDLRRARPERQIAFKFELEEALSKLVAVEWSESGATYTPIGIVEPVRLAGTTVQRANLNNPAMIRSLGLRLGSRVRVVKRGEIIPKIEGLAPEAGGAAEETFPIAQPEACGTCGTALEDAGTRLFCPNPACPKRLRHRVEKWVDVLDVREFGDKLLDRLFGAGKIARLADLYDLSEDDLLALDRMGELSAAKALRHLRSPRALSLAAFVAGFDFEGVGETIMEKVAAAGFDTLEKLRAASVEELASVHGLGEITARTIAEGLVETAADMDAVLEGGVVSIAPPLAAEEAPLRGLSFCFTGELSSLKRNEAEERIKKLGGLSKGSVAKDLSFLVTNDPESGSSKNAKALKLGVPILDEAAFLALLADPAGFLAANPRAAAAPAPAAPSAPKAAQGDLFGSEP